MSIRAGDGDVNIPNCTLGGSQKLKVATQAKPTPVGTSCLLTTPQEELEDLANLLEFKVLYTVIPSKNKTDVVTLVKLATTPPKVKQSLFEPYLYKIAASKASNFMFG